MFNTRFRASGLTRPLAYTLVLGATLIPASMSLAGVLDEIKLCVRTVTSTIGNGEFFPETEILLCGPGTRCVFTIKERVINDDITFRDVTGECEEIWDPDFDGLINPLDDGDVDVPFPID